jgi:hypothetical protein
MVMFLGLAMRRRLPLRPGRARAVSVALRSGSTARNRFANDAFDLRGQSRGIGYVFKWFISRRFLVRIGLVELPPGGILKRKFHAE